MCEIYVFIVREQLAVDYGMDVLLVGRNPNKLKTVAELIREYRRRNVTIALVLSWDFFFFFSKPREWFLMLIFDLQMTTFDIFLFLANKSVFFFRLYVSYKTTKISPRDSWFLNSAARNGNYSYPTLLQFCIEIYLN